MLEKTTHKETLTQETGSTLANLGRPVAKKDNSVKNQNEDLSSTSILSAELEQLVVRACQDLPNTEPQEIIQELATYFFPDISKEEVKKALILVTKSKVEKDPNYAFVCARILLDSIYQQVLSASLVTPDLERLHQEKFISYIEDGIDAELLTPLLKEFDLKKLSAEIQIKRDFKFKFMGLQTLYDRYLIHIDKKRIETPQYFWMRVAMGLSLKESNKEESAIKFYNLFSNFYFIPSTPTLFNSGTKHPQLSSCFLTTITDDLGEIFKGISDNAKLSKWAGGLGNDWTNVRGLGAKIKGTNGESQGIIPFLKVANDTAIAVNQGGKRQGAVCAYLETWHLDIEDFLDLRKNTGDDRRRTHDMNTANWIPDLFMQRVRDDKTWTLFSPEEVSDLHDIYGVEFNQRYHNYEKLAEEGKINKYKVVSAKILWQKMLSMLFETGHPWITFKDPSNIRSPQSHVGVVHSSNLCTEILLNTSKEETAVCNLGSVNLVAHIIEGQSIDSLNILARSQSKTSELEIGSVLNQDLLRENVRLAVKALDNVIDINFYPTPEAKKSNQSHRPIGLGIMGFQDCLYELGMSYASDEAMDFADASMEFISFYAIEASHELSKTRGKYQSFAGSKWSQGLLPIDTLALLVREREKQNFSSLEVDKTQRLDWDSLREKVRQGMRNSNTLAIAPTATIANIAGVSASIEPTYRNLFVKANLSGDFISVNEYLVNDLKEQGLWSSEVLEKLKYHDGILKEFEEIPQDIKTKYLTAFEIEPRWLIEAASRRQKWIDMGQSLNLYVSSVSGKVLHQMYFLAWEKGLKTTYYLRSQAATQVEKSTVDLNKLSIQPKWMKNKSASSEIRADNSKGQSCAIDDPTCEVCQ